MEKEIEAMIERRKKLPRRRKIEVETEAGTFVFTFSPKRYLGMLGGFYDKETGKTVIVPASHWGWGHSEEEVIKELGRTISHETLHKILTERIGVPKKYIEGEEEVIGELEKWGALAIGIVLAALSTVDPVFLLLLAVLFATISFWKFRSSP